MIFSLLNVRKKTAATLAGISIGALCLWGVAMWQDISVQELFNSLLAILLLLVTVIGAAFLLIAAIKLSLRVLRSSTQKSNNQAKHRETDSSAANSKPAEMRENFDKEQH